METLVATLTPSGAMPGSRSLVLGSKPGEYVRVDDLEGGEDVRRDFLNGWRAIDRDKECRARRTSPAAVQLLGGKALAVWR